MYDNHGGITHLEAEGEVLARLRLYRLMGNISPAVILELQSSFTSSRETVDIIFCQTNTREMN